MKHYNFKEIKEHGDCVRFVTEVLGIQVENGRCVAVWRDGDRDSVTIEREQYYDHATQTGGGIIDLCAVSKFGGTDASAIQKAQEFLGDWLHLEEVKLRKAPSGKANRYDDLIAAGYKEVKRYEYRDLEGKLVHFVCRMEHPVEHKEFVQGTPNHWGLGDVTPILYNLAAIAKSPWCIIVEGEKDVDTLSAIGVPATTNAGGAKKWNHEYSEYFKGKEVIILPDNDDVGQEHGRKVAADLFGIAGGIKIVTCSRLPKGDVTDYFTQEGGTWESLSAMIAGAPAYEKIELDPVEAAKEANKKPFQNFITEEIEQPGKRPPKKEKHPRQINELVSDLHTRLLGAPFCVGNDTLFDRDRDTGRILYLHTPADLFSWIGRKTRQLVFWERIPGAVDRQDFFSALRSEANRYEAISFVPDFPARDDVFYAHEKLPSPSPGHEAFWNFIDFFSPDGEINRWNLAALTCSLLYFCGGGLKPLWIIDSQDGRGVGKSTVAKMIAELFGSPAIDTSLQKYQRDPDEIKKRLLSSSGRNARVFLLDNVEGQLRSSDIAALVTSAYISGRPAYARGEECRPNNLTYVVTLNSASVDTDMASRAFFLYVRKPAVLRPNWEGSVKSYIRENRMHVFSDMIDMLQKHVQFADMPPCTRTPDFETEVLQAVCGTPEAFKRLIEFQTQRKAETNLDSEIGEALTEKISDRIRNVKPIIGASVIDPEQDRVFIAFEVIRAWFGKEFTKAQIIDLAQSGFIPAIDPTVTRWTRRTKKTRKRGFLWNAKSENPVRLIIEKNGEILEDVAE